MSDACNADAYTADACTADACQFGTEWHKITGQKMSHLQIKHLFQCRATRADLMRNGRPNQNTRTSPSPSISDSTSLCPQPEIVPT